MLDGAERSGGASAVAAGGGIVTAQAVARKRGSSGAAAAGGSDALLGPALGKQGSRAEEGERRERERVDFDFSQNFQWKLEKV